MEIWKKNNAYISTLAVALAFLFIHFCYCKFTYSHILLIVAAQTIGGINFDKINSVRLKVSLQFSIILLLTGCLGITASHNVVVSLIAIVVLSFCINCWYRFFPENGTDLVIPSGLIFFMLVFTPNQPCSTILLILQGAMIGFLLQLLVVVFRKSFKINTEDIALPISWNISMKQEDIDFTIRLAILLLIGYTIAKWKNLPHGNWIPFTIIVLHRHSFSVTRFRILKRLLGTLCGVLITAVVLKVNLHKEYLFIIVLVSNCLSMLVIKTNYTLAVMFISIFVLVQSEYTTGIAPFSMALERLVYTTFAGILVLLFTFLKPIQWIRNGK